MIGSADSHYTSGFFDIFSTDLVGLPDAPLDPMLGILQNNGVPAPTMALLPGSPAIDNGQSGNAPTNDQRGVTRPQNSYVDIGAYEVTPPLLLSPSSVPSGMVGAAYKASFTASGGFGPLALEYTITSGAIPVGLQFNVVGNQLLVSGTPTAAGSVSFTVTAQDAVNGTISRDYKLTISSSNGSIGGSTDTSSGSVGSTSQTAESPTPAQLQQAGLAVFGMTMGLHNGNLTLFWMSWQQFNSLPLATQQHIGQMVHSLLMQSLTSGLAQSDPLLVDNLLLTDGLLSNNLFYIALVVHCS